MITFFVPGQPVGKGRPRIGKVGQHARMFTPAKTANYEDTVRYAAHQAMGGGLPLFGPVRVRLDIRLQIPASWSGVKQRRAAAGGELPTTKPDIDNVEKAIFDACNGILWRDDVQVVEVTKRKRYSLQPGVSVEAEAVDLRESERQGELLPAPVEAAEGAF